MRKLYCLLLLFTVSSFVVRAQVRDTFYTEKPISLKTATGDIAGTLTLPDRKGGPVALIIAGSGPTDRNGNSMFTSNNSLQLLARELANAGIASVRFDKRGVGASAQAMKSEADLRFEDYIKDASAWVQLLKKDKQFNSVVVIGHSEGALIGMVAAATAGAKKYVSIAGAARPIDEVLMEQLQASSKELHDLSVPIIDSLKKGLLVTNVDRRLVTIFRPSVQPYMISWLKFNPQKEIKKLNMPVLLVQGTNDIQVPVEDAKLLSAAKPAAQLKLITNMNHVLKQVEGDRAANAATYKDPNLPLAPGLIDAIAVFIKKK